MLLLGILHFIADDYIPGIVAALRDALAPGSYVVITHIGGYVTRRTTGGGRRRGTGGLRQGQPPAFPRAEVEFTRLLDGFELIDPVVMAAAAAPDELDTASGEGIVGWRLVARRS